jgi:hypothetical protein
MKPKVREQRQHLTNVFEAKLRVLDDGLDNVIELPAPGSVVDMRRSVREILRKRDVSKTWTQVETSFGT